MKIGGVLMRSIRQVLLRAGVEKIMARLSPYKWKSCQENDMFAFELCLIESSVRY